MSCGRAHPVGGMCGRSGREWEGVRGLNASRRRLQRRRRRRQLGLYHGEVRHDRGPETMIIKCNTMIVVGT